MNTTRKSLKPPRVNLRSDVVTSKFIRLLSLLLISSFLLVLPWFHGATGLFEQLFVQTGTYSFFLLVCTAFLLSSKTRTPPNETAIDSGFLLAALLTMMSVVFSVLPFYSLMTAVRFGAIIIFFILVRTVFTSGFTQKSLLGVVLAAGLLYGLYGLLQLKGVFPKDYWYETHSLASRYVNSGHFAGFLVMPFFSALIFFVLVRSFAARFVLMSMLLFLSVVIVLTKSRTVWVSLAAGFCLFLLMLNAARPFLRKFFISITLGAAVLVVAAFFSGIWNSIAVRFLELKSMNFFSIYHRFHFWQGALSAIISRPWGWGLGTFVHIFPHFRVHSDRFIVDYAHNEILQLGVDLGVLGIGAFIFLLGTYIRISWSAMRSEARAYEDKIQIAGIAASMFTLSIASQFDFPLRIYATAFFAAAFLGVQACLMGKDNQKHKRLLDNVSFYKRKWVLAAFTLAGLVLSGVYLHAETAYQQGRLLERNFEWESAMKDYQIARRYAPWASEYDEAGGRLAEKRAALMMNSEARQQWLRTALDFYISASHKNRFWPSSFYKAGILSDRLGDTKQAETYFGAAHGKDPKNPLFTFEYGLKRLESGHLEEGMDLLEDFVKDGYYDPVPLTQTQILEKVFPYVRDARQLRRVIFKGAYALHDFGLFLIQKRLDEEGTLVLHEAAQEIREQSGYLFYLDHFGLLDAQAYSQAGLYSEAAAIYEEAIKESPHPASYQGYLDAVLKKMKEL